MAGTDLRVWEPDGSCRPWQIETAVDQDQVDPIVARWTVPSGLMMVISSQRIQEGLSVDYKRLAAIIYRGRNLPAPPDQTTAADCVPLNGALSNVEEFGNDTPGLSIPGFNVLGGLAGAAAIFPVRIVLGPGDYTLARYSISPSVPQVGWIATLSGWLYPIL